MGAAIIVAIRSNYFILVIHQGSTSIEQTFLMIITCIDREKKGEHEN